MDTQHAQAAGRGAMSLTVKLQAPYLSLDLIACAIAIAEVSKAIPPTLRERRQALARAADDWNARLPTMLKGDGVTPLQLELEEFAAVDWEQWEPKNHFFHVDDLNACAGLTKTGLTFEVVAEDTKQTLEDVALIAEQMFNGHLIDWDDWLHQMPDLGVVEATRLMCGLDPELYEDLDWRPPRNAPRWLCLRAAKMERQARAAGIDRMTAFDWLRWALSVGYQVHNAFTMAVQELPTSAELEDELKRSPRGSGADRPE